MTWTILTLLLILQSGTSEIIVAAGESGHGKSTTAKYVFKVPEFIKITNKKQSTTKTVNTHYAGENSKYFSNWTILDTPGFFDTDDLTDKQILELLRIALTGLQDNLECNDSEKTCEAQISGFVFIIRSHGLPRDHTIEHLQAMSTAFGMQVLDSLVIVMNRRDDMISPSNEQRTRDEIHDYEIFLREKLFDISLEGGGKRRKIPFVHMNCKNPSEGELTKLHNAFDDIQPYRLKHLYKQKQEINKIFKKLLKDPKNYKTHIQNYVENHKEKIKKDVVVKQDKQVTNQKCFCQGGFNLDLKIISFKSGCKIKCVYSTENVVVDQIKTLQVEQNVPKNVQKEEKFLKNEENFYWNVASDMYKKIIEKMFKKQNSKDEL